MTEKIWKLYCITNLINNKVYIGQTIDVSKRWSDHRKAFNNLNPTQIIHHAMIKYGIENFLFEVIASCNTQDNANELETLLVSQYDSHISAGKGYNATLGGMNSPKTDQWKKKISDILMGHFVSDETKVKISEANMGHIPWNKGIETNLIPWNKGISLSEEAKENLKNKNSGKHFSPETEIKPGQRISIETEFKIRQRVSVATEFKIGQEPWNKGKVFSEELKIKMRKFSPEQEKEIAYDLRSNRELAKIYNVDKKTISNIRKRW